MFNRAEKLASTLPPLLVAAERVAETVRHGVHGRRRSGAGEDFWQFRPYDSSDPASRIDWRQSARGDKLYVRMREWDSMQSVGLWADNSGSMRYASTKNLPMKSEQAQLLMLALASLLLRGGERVLWSEEREFVGVNGKSGLENVARRMTGGVPLPPVPPQLQHATIILASDFLMPPEELESSLHRYAAQNLHGVLLHIVDPLEESFALDGRVELQGTENENPILLPNAAAMRDAYRKKFAEHQARLQGLAQKMGWLYRRHITNQSPQQALLWLYTSLAG